MAAAAATSKLSKEVVAYLLGPPDTATSDKGAPSHAAIVSLGNPSASSPLANLRGTTPFPSSSSYSVATSQDSTSSLVVHADRQRPLIHVHTYDAAGHLDGSGGGSSSSSKSVTQTCALQARLHPPEPTPTLSLSPRGDMLAAGSESGRLYLWHLSSGHLLASVDAHFRAVSCLSWTACGQAIVSGGEDARILIWTVEALVKSGTDDDDETDDEGIRSAAASLPPMPYTVLADHVEAVTAIVLSSSAHSSVSSFPSSLRIMSASSDGTVKLWDVRTRSLVATWSMPGPVRHLTCDVGFRSFFAVVRQRDMPGAETAGASQQQSYDWVSRVDLFSSTSDDVKMLSTGTSAASMMQVSDGPECVLHRVKAGTRISSMAVSTFGSHLLLGTSDAQMVTIDIASGVAIRTTPLLAVGAEGSNAKGGVEVRSLRTFLVQDSSSLLHGTLGRFSNRSTDASAWQLADRLDRTVVKHGTADAPPLHVRLEKRDVRSLLHSITPPSLLPSAGGCLTSQDSAGGKEDAQSLRNVRQQMEELERDNERLKGLLKRAQTTNADLWERLAKEENDDKGQTMQIDV